MREYEKDLINNTLRPTNHKFSSFASSHQIIKDHESLNKSHTSRKQRVVKNDVFFTLKPTPKC